MGNVLAVMRAFFLLVPLVIDLIKGVEEVMPEAGKGKEKAEFVRIAIETAFEKVSGVTVSFTEVWKVIEPFIAKVVNLFNSNGTFSKK